MSLEMVKDPNGKSLGLCPPLPAGWTAKWSPTKGVYYYLKGSTTTWNRPSDTVVPAPWQAYWSIAKQTHFYINSQTNANQWTHPAPPPAAAPSGPPSGPPPNGPSSQYGGDRRDSRDDRGRDERYGGDRRDSGRSGYGNDSRGGDRRDDRRDSSRGGYGDQRGGGGRGGGYGGRGGGGGGGGFWMADKSDDKIVVTTAKPEGINTNGVIALNESAGFDALSRDMIEQPFKKRDDRDDPPEETAVVPMAEDADEWQLPHRPGWGTEGDEIQVVTNYLQLKFDSETEFYLFKVDFEPRCGGKDDAALRRQAMTIAEDGHKSALGGGRLAYDGDHIALAPSRLPADDFEVHIKMPAQRGFDEERPMCVKFSCKGKVNMRALNHYQKGYISEMPQAPINALNLVMQSMAARKTTHIRNNFFTRDFGRCTNLGGTAEVWDGFHTSVRYNAGGPMVNIDLANATFYKQQPILDFICEVLGVRSPPPFLDPIQKDKVKLAMKKLLVVATHSKRDRRYTVNGLSELPLEDITFEQDVKQLEGEERNPEEPPPTQTVRVVDYFRKTYPKVQIRYPGLPAIEQRAGKDRKLYIPMELCTICGSQPFKKKLSPAQTQEMIKHTTKKPDIRLRTTQDIISKRNFGADECVKHFGLQISDGLCKTSARVLRPPTLEYSARKAPDANGVSIGAWNLRGLKMLKNGDRLRDYGVISLSSHRSNRDIETGFQNMFKQFAMQGVPCDLGRPFIVSERDFGRRAGYEDMFQAVLDKIPKAQIIFVVLADKSADTYQEIKNIGDVKFGVITQCMVDNWFKPGGRPPLPTFANISLKVNMKMGGVNHKVKRTGRITFDKTMICGADVTHPMGGEEQESITALVASMDDTAGQYNSITGTAEPRCECIDGIDTMMAQQLEEWRTRNGGSLPEKVIFYRDGLGETQFQMALAVELTSVVKGCAQVANKYNAKPPLVTYIIVQKRHHTRFYQQDRRYTDKSGNAKTGHVIDRTITSAQFFDFFLQSHAGLQGTSRPSRYTVIYDDNKLSADEAQRLTYDLCWCYQRCTRTPSIPSPVYYAHLAAYRNRAFYSRAVEGPNGIAQERGYLPDAQQRRKDEPGALQESSLSAQFYSMSLVHDNLKSKTYWM